MDYNCGKIDLHIHSTASDGTRTPYEILSLATELGLKAISITDHDSVEGVKALLKTGERTETELLTGVEISAAPPPAFNLPGSIHILGYGMDIDNKKLAEALNKQQQSRINRTPKIISRLNDMGIAASLADIQSQSENEQIGRPHIAQWLVKNGHAASMDDAFDKFLGKGRPAYVEKERMPMNETIQKIRASGGIAVLAHPGLLKFNDRSEYERFVIELVSMGLQGIEVYYPEHSAAQRSFFKYLADKLGLLISGGTDFHGDLTPEIQLGAGRGDLYIPYAIYESIVDAITLNTHH
ncbi:MAG: PHP domain-containing protein [Desulfobacterales bacterium]|nr:PHP domain-containing protein [Desulfobacterales bacterium]